MTSTVDSPPASSPTGGRHFIRQGPSRRWMAVFTSLLVLSAVAGAVLAAVGIKTVRESRAGEEVSTVTDPAAPGFEAFLEPTPTFAVVHGDGSFVRSIAVLSLRSGDAGGSVLLVSPQLRNSDTKGSLPFSVAAAYFARPADDVLPKVQAAIGFGVPEHVLVDDARWAALAAPVAPLTVENPSAVGEFPAGSITLTAEQVGPFLAATVDGEGPQVATQRHLAFYRAWIEAVAASDDPAVIPGEAESGIGRFVRGLAGGPVTFETVPFTESVEDDAVAYSVDRDAMDAMVADLVPFPTAGAPGGRIRVRVLDGTGDGQHVQTVAPLLVPAGVEIVVVGNADRFDYEETEVRYHTPAVKAVARDLVEAMAAGRIVDDPRQTDAFDVTIVLGTDV